MGNAQQQQRNTVTQPQMQNNQSPTTMKKGSIVDFGQTQPVQIQNKKISSLLDDDDDVPVTKPPIQQQPQIHQQQAKTNDPFDILGLDIGGGGNSGSIPVSKPPVNTGGDLLGGFSFDGSQPQQVQKTQSNQSGGFGSLLDDGFLGGGNTVQQPPKQPVNTQPQQSMGFDFLGTGATSPTQVPQPQTQTQTQTQNYNANLFSFDSNPTQQQSQQNQNAFKFKAYETPHVEIWMEGKK